MVVVVVVVVVSLTCAWKNFFTTKSYVPLQMHNIHVLPFHSRCPGLSTLHRKTPNDYRRTNIFKLLLGTFDGKSWCLSKFGLLQQKYHRLGGLNNRDLFLTVLKTENSKIKVPTDSVPGESFLPNLQRDTFLLYPNMVERDFISPVFSYKGTNPIHEGFIIVTSLLPEGPTSRCHHFGD